MSTALLWAVLSIAVVWIAVIFAGSYSEGAKLFDILENFSAALQSPLSLKWTAHTPKTILVFLFLYALGVGFYYSTKENRRPGEEHGSAKWGV